MKGLPSSAALGVSPWLWNPPIWTDSYDHVLAKSRDPKKTWHWNCPPFICWFPGSSPSSLDNFWKKPNLKWMMPGVPLWRNGINHMGWPSKNGQKSWILQQACGGNLFWTIWSSPATSKGQCFCIVVRPILGQHLIGEGVQSWPPQSPCWWIGIYDTRRKIHHWGCPSLGVRKNRWMVHGKSRSEKSGWPGSPMTKRKAPQPVKK